MVRLPDTFADGFLRWHDNFITAGRTDSANEKSGTLEFFAPQSDKPYFGINLDGLGMISLAMGKSALRTKTGTPVTVQMYCESAAKADCVQRGPWVGPCICAEWL